MHELVFPPVWDETAQAVDHVGAGAAGDPDVAVDDPDDVPFRGAVAVGHIPDLGVWPESIVGSEVGVFVFDEDFGVVGGKVLKEGLEDWVAWVRTRGDTEVDVEF